MIQALLDDLKAYFDAKEKPTEQERQFKLRLSEGYFPVAFVHREDLQWAGFDVEKISDARMRELAGKMGKDYREQSLRDSVAIIAGILGFPKTKDIACPKCNSENVRYDIHESRFHCDTCFQTWDDRLYVLVEFPEDSGPFEEESTGYPAWDSGDNGARYVPEQEYIREFRKSPDPEKYYRPLCWPDSQEYMEKEGCEPIQDEDGIQDFGTSACWVPLSLIKKSIKPERLGQMEEYETPVCPECGGTDIEILSDEGVAICNNCHLEWPYMEE